MIKQNKQFFLRFFVLSIIMSVFFINLYPRLVGNKGGCVYEYETCPDSTAEGIIAGAGINGMSSTSISGYIVYGAGSFLDSHAAILNFFNKIEMAEMTGLNFTTLRGTLYQAIKSMELAKDMYTSLVEIALVTPYKISIIEKLKKLDYEVLQIRNGLNTTTFKKVEHYLHKGDVTGLFTQLMADSEMILDMLYILKETVDKDQVPFNKDLWKLAQAYSEFHMFGQYAAQIFYEVSGSVE